MIISTLHIRKNLFFLIMISMISFRAHGLIVYDHANFLQNRLAAINSVKSLAHQAKSLRYQFSQYANDLKNMQKFFKISWDDSYADLKNLAKLQARGKGVSYNIIDSDQQFKNIFSNFKEAHKFYSSQKKLQEVVIDTLKNSLGGINLQSKNFEAENKIKKNYEKLSENSIGQMQILQSANMLTAMQVGQLQRLRELLINQINTQNTYYAHQVTIDKEKNEQVLNWLKKAKTKIPTYGEGRGFGLEDL